MNLTGPCPVYAFQSQPSLVDYPGRLAAVFFVSGCSFRCGFCHNAPLMGAAQATLTWERIAVACRRFSADWVDGAVISGGEPTLAAELDELIGFFHSLGWRVKLDTNGARPAVLEAVVERLDYVAMDVKAGLSGYPELTGFDDTAAIDASIRLIRERAADYEFRTTVLPVFHTDDQMLEIGSLIAGARRYCLQPFVPRPDLPDPAYRAMPRTHPDRLATVAGLMQPFVSEIIVRGG